jgi:phosphatidylserine decarboxylase
LTVIYAGVIILVMRVPLTKYGWPEAVVFPAGVLAIMAILLLGGTTILSGWAVVLIESLLAVVFIWLLAFFRDPYRNCPMDKNILLAPADGQITDIETVQEDSFIGSTALRLGIFLSIFDVHINRSPCNAKVERITYRKGKYKNAKNLLSGRVNESNDIWLVRTDNPGEKILVRQISGAIARRIVCDITEGYQLSSGEKFGMIKFGSRTELYVPVCESAKCLVRIGDKVKAGLTLLIRYQQCPD